MPAEFTIEELCEVMEVLSDARDYVLRADVHALRQFEIELLTKIGRVAELISVRSERSLTLR